MKIREKQMQNEDGFVLVASLMFMLVLTIIGIATTTNTSIELQIAGNDKVYKKTFYEAEAGAVLGSEIIEQGFNCPTGFKETSSGVADLNTSIRVYSTDGEYLITNNTITDLETTVGSINNADVAYPITKISSGVETGYLYFTSATNMLPGGALQMAAGYEGKGKSAGQGGVTKVVDIFSQFRGLVGSEAIIQLGWRHLIGAEGDCNYD